MKIKLQIVILSVIVFCSSFSVLGDEHSTNLEIFKDLYFKGFSNGFLKVSVLDSLPLFFNNINKNKTIDWLIEEQFVKSARNAGFETLIHSETFNVPNDGKKYVAEYRSVTNKVQYSALSILPENSQNRLVNIEMYFKVLGPDKQILVSDVIRESFSDTIKVNNIKNIENNNLPFTIGNRSKSLVAKLLEPLLVTLITGSVIYIFYSFRSN